MDKTALTLNPNSTFRYRNPSMIGFWNVQTQHDLNCDVNIGSSELMQLEKDLYRLKIDILAVNLALCRGSNSMLTTTGKCSFMYSGAGSRKAPGFGFPMTS